MKTKDLKLSLLILAGLVISSYGFLISAQEGFNSSANVFSENDASEQIAASLDDENNLTGQVAKQLSDITAISGTGDQQLSVNELNDIINGSINKRFSDDELPTVSPDEIKIKKQDYKGTAEQIKAKKKEDFSNYMVAIYYIFSSSSPRPITSADNLDSVNNYFIDIVTNALLNRNSSGLADLSSSGQKMLDQLKDIEVPEDLVGTHTRALQFAKYAIKLKPAVDADSNDPLADLVNLSKMQSFMKALFGFSVEASAKFTEYGMVYDDTVKNKLTTLGVAPIEISAPDPIDASDAEVEDVESED